MGISIDSSGAEHCANLCKITLTCHCWTYDPVTDQCHQYFNCPPIMDSPGRISGDRDCSSYRENFGLHESSESGSNFKVYNMIEDNGFYLTATYTNSSCNEQAKVNIDQAHNFAQFPNTKDCGPYVIVTAQSYLGTPHFSCKITNTYFFHDLYIKPAFIGASGFAGCVIDTEPYSPIINHLPQIPNENKFFIMVDAIQAGAVAAVSWGNNLCPTQIVEIFGSLPNTPIT